LIDAGYPCREDTYTPDNTQGSRSNAYDVYIQIGTRILPED